MPAPDLTIARLLSGALVLLRDGCAPDRARLTQALGLDADAGAFTALARQSAALLSEGRCAATGERVGVNASFRGRGQVAVSFEEHAIRADEAALMALAPHVQVVHSKTGLGRAYVFEREGVRCAVTVTNATNAVDGVLCEALPRTS